MPPARLTRWAMAARPMPLSVGVAVQHLIHGKTAAVIFNDKNCLLVFLGHLNINMFRIRVFADVCQGFLHDPVDHGLDGQGKEFVNVGQLDLPVNVFIEFLEILHHVAQGRGQAQIFQVAGAQSVIQAAHLLHGIR